MKFVTASANNRKTEALKAAITGSLGACVAPSAPLG